MVIIEIVQPKKSKNLNDVIDDEINNYNGKN